MKLWLDDQMGDPEAPSRWVPAVGFLGARSTAEAQRLVLEHGLPEHMDLDHDLGGEDTAMVFLRWLFDRFPNGPVPTYRIHSANPIGAKAIESYLDSWARSLTLSGDKDW